MVDIRFPRERFRPEELWRALIVPGCGAVWVYIGVVRPVNRGRRVVALEYEVYEEMAARRGRGVARRLQEEFGVERFVLWHRQGRLAPGEPVMVLGLTKERSAQLAEAGKKLLWAAKNYLPIWKKEIYADGSAWLEGTPLPADLP